MDLMAMSKISKIKATVDIALADLEVKKLSMNGSPKGTYDTLALLTSAFPTGNDNIYTVVADGNWYYWKTSAWTSGGLYLSGGLGTSVVDKANVVDGMPVFETLNKMDKTKLTPAFFISPTTGNPYTSALDSYSEYIPVKASTIYTVTEAGHTAFYNSAKVLISGNNKTLALLQWTTPALTAFTRVTTLTSSQNSFMLVEGTDLPEEYIPFSYYLSPKNGVAPILPNDKKQITSNFNMTKALNESTNLLPDMMMFTAGDPVGATLSRYVDKASPLGANVVEVSYLKTAIGYGFKTAINKTVAELGYGVGDWLQYGYFINEITATGFDYVGLAIALDGVSTRFYQKSTLNKILLADGWAYRYSKYQITQSDMDKGMKITEFSFTTTSTSGTLINYKLQCPVITLSHQPINLGEVIRARTLEYKSRSTKYQGITVNMLGDSITQQATWTGTVSKNLRFAGYRNYGLGGTRLSGSTATDMTTRFSAMSDSADMIIVMGGTNDHSQDIAIGDFTSTNRDTYMGGIRFIIEGLAVKYPLKKIVFMTPTCRAEIINSGGKHIKLYADAMKLICSDYGVPVIDLLGEVGFNKMNIATYLADGTHPTAAGGLLMAEYITSRLNSI